MTILSKLNYSLIIMPIVIFSLGFITLLSSSPERAKSQLLFFSLGVLVYALMSIIDHRIFVAFWKHAYIGILVVLLITFLTGIARLGSVRWLNVGFVTFQPSELAKIVLIMTSAGFIASRPAFSTKVKDLILVVTMCFPLILLVFLQPDLGTSIVLGVTLVSILWLADVRKMYFLIGAIAVGFLSNPIWNLLQEYQKVRVLVFLNPQLDVLGRGYNIIQSIISIGSGGFWGKGFGQGSQAHLNFLPVHWTDFIFASFSEEWGFIGVLMFFCAYFLLLYSIAGVVFGSKSVFSFLLGAGILTVFFIQFTVNVGMNIGLLPVTGVTLPLMSYGGTSLVVSMFMLGVVQNIHLTSKSTV